MGGWAFGWAGEWGSIGEGRLGRVSEGVWSASGILSV